MYKQGDANHQSPCPTTDGSRTATCVVGQLVFKRSLSRRLVFYDLKPSEGVADEAHEGVSHGIELVMKAGQDLTEEEVRDYRDSLKLGDVVCVWGALLEGGRELAVTHVTVTSRWRDRHPNQPFIPHQICWPKKAAGIVKKEGWVDAQESQPLSATGPEGNLEQQDSSVASHGACGTSDQQVCKGWINTGWCHKGMACRFAHPLGGIDPRARLSWVASRRQQRKDLARSRGDPHAGSAASKSQRACVFAEWLVATFGAERLSAGTGVIDVAGGRGEVAFQLQTLRGIPATVIDPRPGKLSRSQHCQLAALRADAKSGSPSANAASSTLDSDPGGAEARSGNSSINAASSVLQLHPGGAVACENMPTTGPAGVADIAQEDGGLFSPVDIFEGLGLGNHIFSAATSSAEKDQDKKGLGLSHLASPGACGGEVRGKLPEHLCCEFGPALWEGPLGKLLRSCSVVVGLHPDQATEAILDFALLAGKPFAVVPCCVFGRQFPNRRVLWPSSTEVSPDRHQGPNFPGELAPGGLPDLETPGSNPDAEKQARPSILNSKRLPDLDMQSPLPGGGTRGLRLPEDGMQGSLRDPDDCSGPSVAYASTQGVSAGCHVPQAARGAMLGMPGPSHGSRAPVMEPASRGYGLPALPVEDLLHKEVQLPTLGATVGHDPVPLSTSYFRPGGGQRVGPCEEDGDSLREGEWHREKDGEGLGKGQRQAGQEPDDGSMFVWQRELGASRRSFDQEASGIGVPVVSHAQLVEYLMQRGGGSTRVLHLAFEGLNQVVYRTTLSGGN